MNYTKKGKLSVATELLEFINNELIPGTKINPEKFWKDFDKAVHTQPQPKAQCDDCAWEV